MSKGKILVTPRSLSKNGHPLLRKLEDAGYEVLMPFPGKQPGEEELLSILPACVGYLAGVEKIPGSLLAQCGILKVISRNGVGIDNVDQKAADEHGISIKIARGANSRGVAELTIALMLSLVRSIPQTSNALKNGGWERFKGLEVQGRILGVIGTGQIGQHVAGMAAGLDMAIIGYDPYPDPTLEDNNTVFKYAPLEKVLGTCDILTLHCPAEETPLIRNDTLDLINPGCFLVNTARSALVDQAALLQALDSGQIAGYAVDAYGSEPPEMTALYRHPKVILTSHIGGFTEESVHRATSNAVDNILEVLAAEKAQ